MVAAGLRDYHQKQKTKVDTIHALMDKAEQLLNEIVSDLHGVDELVLRETPLVRNLKNRDEFYRLLERRRLLIVAKETYLRKIFTEIHRQDKKIYPIPTDKLNNLKKSIGDFFDSPQSVNSLAAVVANKNDLMISFHRQPFIWFNFWL